MRARTRRRARNTGKPRELLCSAAWRQDLFRNKALYPQCSAIGGVERQCCGCVAGAKFRGFEKVCGCVCPVWAVPLGQIQDSTSGLVMYRTTRASESAKTGKRTSEAISCSNGLRYIGAMTELFPVFVRSILDLVKRTPAGYYKGILRLRANQRYRASSDVNNYIHFILDASSDWLLSSPF